MYCSTKAKRNSHAVRRCTSHTAFGISMERVFGVTVDNIFIYSRSIEEHKKHLGIVFQRLRDHHLFLSKSKVDLYSKRLECLGHIIDD